MLLPNLERHLQREMAGKRWPVVKAGLAQLKELWDQAESARNTLDKQMAQENLKRMRHGR